MASLLGKSARVIARITGQRCGEVLVSVGLGTEVYAAYSAEHGESFEVGTQVIVVDESPGRTVYVAAS